MYKKIPTTKESLKIHLTYRIPGEIVPFSILKTTGEIIIINILRTTKNMLSKQAIWYQFYHVTHLK